MNEMLYDLLGEQWLQGADSNLKWIWGVGGDFFFISTSHYQM